MVVFMKSKQIILIALILIALVGAWLVAVNSGDNSEELAAQSELTARADAFADKELYVRAIPLYIEALGYDTENTLEIHNKLMSCYLEYGDEDSYIDLAEDRISNKTAELDIYLKVAEIYVDSGKYSEAKELLEVGLKNLGEEDQAAIQSYYESFRYSYTARFTDVDRIFVTDGASVLPAMNGSNYFYVNRRGSKSLNSTYEFATAFNDNGLAVVKADGKYYVINGSAEKYAIDETGVDSVLGLSSKYIIAEKDGKVGFYNIDFELVSEELQFDSISVNGNLGWIVSSGGKYALLDTSGADLTGFKFDDAAINSLGGGFAEMTVEKDGKTSILTVAMLMENGKWYLSDQSGEHIVEKGFSDAKAPEEDGYIAVADESGKWGFINSKGEMVIDFSFEDAHSFSQGLAAVKVDNKWGYINSKGEIAIETQFDDAAPFHGGMAIAERLGKAVVIELELYSE